MMKIKKIAVFTGNRAEYGLQYPVLKAIEKHPNLDYQLMVSGAHLDDNFGNTKNEIINDGFKISSEINIHLDETKKFATPQAIGSGVIEISKELDRLQPDIFVVYADRFEGFAAVIASTQMNIPTAHIEGGDITEGGALDDSVRHAMTKLSHFHFTTNQQATNRILAMGEAAWRVQTVGFPAIDLIQEGNFAKDEEIQEFCSINFQTSFPVMGKIDVNGKNADPLYDFLKSEKKGLLGSKAIKWNFTKFLVNKNGEVIKRYSPNTEPKDIAQDIENLL